MKKLLLAVGFVLMVGVFVSAGFFPEENDRSIFNVNIEKGWNLIYGFADVNQIQEGDISKSDIKAIYVLIPPTQKYIRLYPNAENYGIPDKDIDDILLRTAFWVYSDSSATMEYKLYESFPLIREKELYSNWNLFAVSPDFVFKDFNIGLLRDKFLSLNEVKGNCNIQDAYFWDAKKQEWYKDTKYLDAYFEQEHIGLGVVIKVSNRCNLGISGSGSITQPPQIPTGLLEQNSIRCEDTDGGKNYYLSGVAKTFSDDVDYALDSAGESCVGENNQGNQVIESYCNNGDSQVKQEYYVCPNGCSNGACIQ